MRGLWLALQVQEGLGRDPHAGDLFVFRGKRGQPTTFCIWFAIRDNRLRTGFASVTVIDDDLGRSGSGRTERPGFERLVALVCSGDVGAVYCIEASRLARNERVQRNFFL